MKPPLHAEAAAQQTLAPDDGKTVPKEIRDCRLQGEKHWKIKE